MSFIGNIVAAQSAAAIGKYNAELLNQQLEPVELEKLETLDLNEVSETDEYFSDNVEKT